MARTRSVQKFPRVRGAARAHAVGEVLGRWRSSDLTKAAFCRREGIASVTLNRWLAEFGETPSVPVSGPAFVEAVWGEGVDRALEVVLPTGVRIRVPQGFDAGDLALVLGALATC